MTRNDPKEEVDQWLTILTLLLEVHELNKLVGRVEDLLDDPGEARAEITEWRVAPGMHSAMVT